MEMINSNKEYIKSKSKFILKTIYGDFNVILIDYNEYLLPSLKEYDATYPASRHINFTFKLDDNFLINDCNLFDFDCYFDFDWVDLKYKVIFHFFDNDSNYKNFDIKNILE